MAVLKDQHVHVIRFNAANVIITEFEIVTDKGRLRSAVQGPDGNLYLAQDALPGAILRVTPTP